MRKCAMGRKSNHHRIREMNHGNATLREEEKNTGLTADPLAMLISEYYYSFPVSTAVKMHLKEK